MDSRVMGYVTANIRFGNKMYMLMVLY